MYIYIYIHTHILFYTMLYYTISYYISYYDILYYNIITSQDHHGALTAASAGCELALVIASEVQLVFGRSRLLNDISDILYAITY